MNGEDKKKEEIKELAFNRDESRKSLDKSITHNKLTKKEKGEKKNE